MNIFDLNRTDYRHIPDDKSLSDKVKFCDKLDVYKTIKCVVKELLIPRIFALEDQLSGIIQKHGEKVVKRRINGKIVGEISIAEQYRVYEKRLRTRRCRLARISLSFRYAEDVRKYDDLSDLVYSAVSLLSIEANIANDVRHLFRNEVEEVGKDTVCSSTIPYKINPKDLENVVSFWETSFPRALPYILGQATEHQGDSTNEKPSYYAFELLCDVCYATKKLENALRTLDFN